MARYVMMICVHNLVDFSCAQYTTSNHEVRIPVAAREFELILCTFVERASQAVVRVQGKHVITAVLTSFMGH